MLFLGSAVSAAFACGFAAYIVTLGGKSPSDVAFVTGGAVFAVLVSLLCLKKE